MSHQGIQNEGHLEQELAFETSNYDKQFLSNIVQKRMLIAQIASEEGYNNLLLNNAEERKVFQSSLQNNHSEFFRNPFTFSVLENIIFPTIIHKKEKEQKKEIRIWSAACSAGQEAYSLAIILEELLASKIDKHEINYRIFSTDQNPLNITLAQSGHYLLHDLNNVSLKRVRNWFDNNGMGYIVDASLKNNIEFSEFNLLNNNTSYPSASIFGDFDIVVCANILFYYKPKYKKQILNKVSNAMGNNGLLIVGESEREILLNNNFKECYPQSAIFCRV